MTEQLTHQREGGAQVRVLSPLSSSPSSISPLPLPSPLIPSHQLKKSLHSHSCRLVTAKPSPHHDRRGRPRGFDQHPWVQDLRHHKRVKRDAREARERGDAGELGVVSRLSPLFEWLVDWSMAMGMRGEGGREGLGGLSS
jgi:hypothetical protein